MAGIQAMDYIVMSGLWVVGNVIAWSCVLGKVGILYGTAFAVGGLYLTY
jgi:hypothetical protein